jgi:rhamnose utilization protein RhaD (predicted bifunctional aldolase and dehydrogenase)
MSEPLADLITLSHELGVPARGWAIGAEGNVSVRSAEDSMWVKASGCSLVDVGPSDFVHVRMEPLRELLDDPTAGDAEVSATYLDCRIDPGARKPSVEALLHSTIYSESAADCIAHTHPITVNRLLCSVSAEALVAGSLFPDQIVMLGRRQLLLDYVDPGLALAREVRRQLRTFVSEHGDYPRAIYVRNHGLFILAANTREALLATDMASKVADVLWGALAVGGPVYLSDADVQRIDRRPDELERRQLLAAAEQVV